MVLIQPQCTHLPMSDPTFPKTIDSHHLISCGILSHTLFSSSSSSHLPLPSSFYTYFLRVSDFVFVHGLKFSSPRNTHLKVKLNFAPTPTPDSQSPLGKKKITPRLDSIRKLPISFVAVLPCPLLSLGLLEAGGCPFSSVCL